MKLLENKFKGFTLVELLVSITIIGIISVMSISSYPKFSEQLSVTSETYKILSFGLETKSYGSGSITEPGVKVVYALIIEKNNNTIKRVVIKNPTQNDNQYFVNTFPAASTDPLDNLIIKDNFEISDICYFGIDKTNCDQHLNKVYGIFKRPNPDARLIGLQGTNIGPDTDTGSYDRLEVTLKSKNNSNLQKKLVILSTGQIYVK